MQPQLCLVDFDVRCAVQGAIELIVPRMIGAANAGLKYTTLLFRPCAAQELRTAVPADIVKTTQRVVLITDQQDAFTQNLDESVISLAIQPRSAANTKPLAMKNSLALAQEVRVIQIVGPGQCGF